MPGQEDHDTEFDRKPYQKDGSLSKVTAIIDTLSMEEITEIAQEATDRVVKRMRELEGTLSDGDQEDQILERAAQVAKDRRKAEVDEAQEEDGLYFKYRIFKEPEGEELPHPVPILATALPGLVGMASLELKEVESFVFVLKPDTDRHAQVALAAYAKSVFVTKPRLHDDLMQILDDLTGHIT